MNRPEMREEYDFSVGELGKYVEAAKAGTNVILLDPDVAAVFHDPKQVNGLLRTILESVKINGSLEPDGRARQRQRALEDPTQAL